MSWEESQQSDQTDWSNAVSGGFVSLLDFTPWNMHLNSSHKFNKSELNED